MKKREDRSKRRLPVNSSRPAGPLFADRSEEFWSSYGLPIPKGEVCPRLCAMLFPGRDTIRGVLAMGRQERQRQDEEQDPLAGLEDYLKAHQKDSVFEREAGKDSSWCLFRGGAEGFLGDRDGVLGPIVPDSFHGQGRPAHVPGHILDCLPIGAVDTAPGLHIEPRVVIPREQQVGDLLADYPFIHQHGNEHSRRRPSSRRLCPGSHGSRCASPRLRFGP